MPVRFFSISNKFKIKNSLKIKRWVNNAFLSEGIDKRIDLNIIFCTDDELLNINKEYLNHNYYTDIITFSIDENHKQIEAELYISIDRVEDNARQLNIAFYNELHRVIIHGVLHLCGYSDKSKEDELSMRERESFYLSVL